MVDYSFEKKFLSNPSQIPPGREGMREYVDHSNDRNPPPYFAGRRDILSEIEKTCISIWQRHESNARQLHGLTRIIYGAPGAGKSSTLENLQHLWSLDFYATIDRTDSTLQEPTPVMLYSADSQIFDSLELFCKEIIKIAASDTDVNRFAASSETIRKRADVNLSLIKGGIESERTTQFSNADSGVQAVLNVLSTIQWTRPVVIGIDESQNLTGDQDSPVGKMLQALHANRCNLPILVVLAGLSDTSQRVKDLGLSRLSVGRTHSLEGLDTEEVEELKRGFCAYFDIDLRHRVHEFDAMLINTDGWPAHIQNCLFAFCKVYLEANCNIDSVDFHQVEQLSQAARIEYYHARISHQMAESCQLLGLLMKRLKSKNSRSQVISLIKKIDSQNEDRNDISRSIPDYMTALEYYHHLIHCGALQERNDSSVFCPIPSFRQYMIEVGKEVQDTWICKDVPRYHGLTWDAIERIEATHKIRKAS